MERRWYVISTGWIAIPIPFFGNYLSVQFPHSSVSAMEIFFSKYPIARLELASYLALWLCRVVFTGRGGDYIRSECFFSACRLALGDRPALCPAMVARLCFGLKEHVSDLEGQFKPSERYSGHYFYVDWHATAPNSMSNRIVISLKTIV